MIIACGGIKGGSGKTTIAVHLAIELAKNRHHTLLIDADEQGSASEFSFARRETLSGAMDYQLSAAHGAELRDSVLKHDEAQHIVIDVGGRDTESLRAALSVADHFLIPFLPSSFDVWALDRMIPLIESATAFNPTLQVLSILNRADAVGHDNEEAIEIANEVRGIHCLPHQLGNRKAFRSATASGLSINEFRPKDPKAIQEINQLFTLVLHTDR